MSRTRIYSGITLEALSRMRDDSNRDYAVELDASGVSGTVSKPTPFGNALMRFEHDGGRAEMTVTILKKPALLPAAVLWAGVAHALRRAGGAPPAGENE